MQTPSRNRSIAQIMPVLSFISQRMSNAQRHLSDLGRPWFRRPQVTPKGCETCGGRRARPANPKVPTPIADGPPSCLIGGSRSKGGRIEMSNGPRSGGSVDLHPLARFESLLLEEAGDEETTHMATTGQEAAKGVWHLHESPLHEAGRKRNNVRLRADYEALVAKVVSDQLFPMPKGVVPSQGPVSIPLHYLAQGMRAKEPSSNHTAQHCSTEVVVPPPTVVDHHGSPAPGPQNPGHLAKDPVRVRRMVDDAPAPDEIEGRIPEGHPFCIHPADIAGQTE